MHHEGENVAVRAATEAVIAIVLREYDKRRGLLGMEWTEAGQCASSLAQLHALAHRINQTQASLDFFGWTTIDQSYARARLLATYGFWEYDISIGWIQAYLQVRL